MSYEPTAEETNAAQDAVQPYRKQINESVPLTSLLYDIDLLPEQIRIFGNAARMIAVCEIFKRLTPEAVDSLFSETVPNEAVG